MSSFCLFQDLLLIGNCLLALFLGQLTDFLIDRIIVFCPYWTLTAIK